jgi:hypothetical protein
MYRTAVFLAAAVTATLAAPAIAQTAPAGWKTERPAAGVTLFTPPDLKQGETYSVAIYDEQAMGGKPIEEWLAAAIGHDPVMPGKVQGTPKIQAPSANIGSGVATFLTGEGKPVAAIYTAVSLDRENTRVMRVLMWPASVHERYKEEALKISSAMVAASKKSAVESGRGTDVERLPTTPNGMTPGGQIQEGIYAGNKVYDNEIRSRYRLYLYANGEFRLCDEKGEEIRFGNGQYQYDPRTGKMEIGRTFDLNNDRFDPDDEVCLYGRDAEGKPYVYANADWGFGRKITTLRYVGPIDRPSPETEKEVKARAEEEARRYKWVTEPGKGLPINRIAGILHNYQTRMDGMGGVTADSDLYVLLTDGTVYNGLPVAPDQWDVSRSRRMEPEKWGRWKRSGQKIIAAWADNPAHYEQLKGLMVKPGVKGQRLDGRFGTGSSSVNLMGGSYRLWGVTFTKDGRFVKDNRGGYGSSILSQTTTGTSIHSTYDDKGSYTAASGENFVVGSGKKKPEKNDRSGTYSVDGYTLTLRFDDGRVVRLPFFFGDGDRDSIWFEGAYLSLSRDKK